MTTRSAAQVPDSSLAGFVARARAGTTKYQDQKAAIADGYRAIGPDSPGMGQHWVHPSLLVDGRLDPSRPQILEYIPVLGTPTLIGVTYAIPLAHGEELPDAPPGRAAWHYHTGTVDEESLPLGHSTTGHGGAALRVAVLHAWIWLENPAGIFESENWALPFARLGMAVPQPVSPRAAKALSLLTGGDTYLDVTLRAVGRPDSSDAAAIKRILARNRQRVDTWRSGATGRAPSAEVIASLADLWVRMWGEIGSAVNPVVRERLQALHEP
jgi:hypothetical protein